MRNTKAEVMELLDGLPDDCLLEEIERELYIRHARDEAEATGEDCILRPCSAWPDGLND